jgi:hypothetical protein
MLCGLIVHYRFWLSRPYNEVVLGTTNPKSERATENVRDEKRLLRNEITFQDCRKFSADSKVSFGPEQR